MKLVTGMRFIGLKVYLQQRYTFPMPASPHIDYEQCTDNIATTPHSLPTSIFHSPIYSICYGIQSPCTHDVMTCVLRFCGSPNGQGAVNHRTPRNVIQLQPQNRPCLCLLLLLASTVSLYTCLPPFYQTDIRYTSGQARILAAVIYDEGLDEIQVM